MSPRTIVVIGGTSGIGLELAKQIVADGDQVVISGRDLQKTQQIAADIGPGATAYLLTDSFERMLTIAVGVAVTSAALGTIVSFHIDGATGACIVLVQMMFFVAAFLFAPKRGLLTRAA